MHDLLSPVAQSLCGQPGTQPGGCPRGEEGDAAIAGLSDSGVFTSGAPAAAMLALPAGTCGLQGGGGRALAQHAINNGGGWVFK